MSFDKMNENKTLINDIVHGIIWLPPYIRQIIDTERFQRLRYILQLGLGTYVYPSASYPRFEHSIGAFHLSSLLMEQLKQQIESENLDTRITENDVKCVEIAALCHDLGHGPFSHFWSHAFSKSSSIEHSSIKKHEDLSVEIFEDLVNNTHANDGESIKRKIGLNDEMIDKIGRIILGKYDKEKDSNKKFLFEIVANKESGLDVDKFDYLCRDPIYFGWSNKNKIHDIKRIMCFLKVVKDKDVDEWRLAVRDREIFHIFDIFYYRHLLHRYGYQHKTVKALECMLKKALDTLNAKGKLGELAEHVLGKVQDCKKIDVLYSKEFISKCCDLHIWEIMEKYTNDIVVNIRRRNLYKLYCKLQLNKKIDPEDESKLERSLNTCLKDSSITVSIASSSFSLSSEKGNPIYRIPFYKKNLPKECFMFNEKSNPPPSLLKYTNEEFNILIFTDRIIEGGCEEDKILNDIIEKMCEVDDFEKLQILKERLEDIVNNNFEENENNHIKNTKESIIEIINKINVHEVEEANESTWIDELRKKYTFRRMNY